MKLASLKNGSRDGRLAIVSSDLKRAVYAAGAATLIEALENWSIVESGLRRQATRLEQTWTSDVFAFHVEDALAPLPRAPQWLDASAFRTHSALTAAAWGNKNRWSDEFPLVYQGASDDFQPSIGPAVLPDAGHDIDLEGEIAVIVDEVPMGVDAQTALDHIRLVVLVNDVSLRAFGAREQEAGFGFIQAKPSTIFSPVAVTPDALGDAWHDGRLQLPVTVHVNGNHIGDPNAGHMAFSFGELIAHVAKTRKLSAGTIIGSGTVSDPDRTKGSAAILEVRAIEKITFGEPRTPFLKFGERVTIDVRNEHGATVFGAIDHLITQA